jgi:hypothetical protein
MVSSKSPLWSKYVTPEEILPTKKVFFGKYPYKAEFHILAAHYMRVIGKKSRTAFALIVQENREMAKKQYTSAGAYSWAYRRYGDLEKCDSDQLFNVNEYVKSHCDKLKIRIEQNIVHVYAATELDMLTAVDFITTAGAMLTCVCMPPDAHAVELTTENVILCKRPPKLPYRVYITEGRYSDQTMQQIYNYLITFKDDVGLPKGLLYDLASPGKNRYAMGSYLSGYFYVADLSTLTFLTMISPKFVKKIFKMVQLTG